MRRATSIARAPVVLAVLGAIVPLSAFAACSSSTDDASVATTDGGGEASATDGRVPDTGHPMTKDGGDGSTTPTSPIVGVRDRAGKPYVSLLLVSASNREAYNQDPVDFVLPTDPDPDPDGGTTFAADFQVALVKLDLLDGKSDWDGGAPTAAPDEAGVYPHPLESAWLTVDALVVDPNKPFSPTGYLDVEVNPTTHATCGGRWPGDDALDKTLSYLVKKSLTGVSDGVSAPGRTPALTFPYLAAPY